MIRRQAQQSIRTCFAVGETGGEEMPTTFTACAPRQRSWAIELSVLGQDVVPAACGRPPRGHLYQGPGRSETSWSTLRLRGVDVPGTCRRLLQRGASGGPPPSDERHQPIPPTGCTSSHIPRSAAAAPSRLAAEQPHPAAPGAPPRALLGHPYARSRVTTFP